MDDVLLLEVWSKLDYYELVVIDHWTLHKGIQDAAQELTRLRAENEKLLGTDAYANGFAEANAEANARQQKMAAKLAELYSENEKLRACIAAYADCAVEYDAKRYLVVRVSNTLWKKTNELLGSES